MGGGAAPPPPPNAAPAGVQAWESPGRGLGEHSAELEAKLAMASSGGALQERLTKLEEFTERLAAALLEVRSRGDAAMHEAAEAKVREEILFNRLVALESQLGLEVEIEQKGRSLEGQVDRLMSRLFGEDGGNRTSYT